MPDTATEPAVAVSPEEAVSMPVCLAFQLGWDMSRLYRVVTIREPLKYTPAEKLPSQRDFRGVLNTERRLVSVSAGLHRMTGALETAGLERPSLGPLLSAYTGGGSKEELSEAVYRLHLATLIAVQSADARLGSAYSLGRALADSALQSDLSVLRASFGFYRVKGLRDELAQLASSFPPHSARAVSNSLCMWQCVLEPRLKKGASGKGPERALPRQAEVWRGLLSGERIGSDRLDAADYVRASRRLVDRANSVAWGVIRSYWIGLAAGLSLVIIGITVAIAVGGAVAVVTGIGAAASALGISWRGVASTLAALAGRLRAPLWGAELDLAIAQAVTVPEARDAYAQLPAPSRRCEVAAPQR